MKEIWKDVRDFKGLYQVSNLGRVKSLIRKRNGKDLILKVDVKNGYYQVDLSRKGQRPKKYRVHRMVFEAFYRRLLPNEVVHHLNKNRACNQSTNLVAKDRFIHLREHMEERKSEVYNENK